MEVPSIYRFVGQKTNIDMLSKLLDIPNTYLLRLKVLIAECGQVPVVICMSWGNQKVVMFVVLV